MSSSDEDAIPGDIFEASGNLIPEKSKKRGLALVSQKRRPRINAIAEVLSASDVDVVCLQEVWTDEDFELIRDRVIDNLPHSHYFYSGVTGSGICIFSKHFIEETFFHQWSVNGYIHKLHHGDWWAGKGVGLCKLNVRTENETFCVNVYSAHLHAEYNRASDDYQAHRVLQAYDTAQFILLTSGCADLVVLAGDLNTEPEDLAYRTILTVLGLTDAYKQVSDTAKEMYATCENCLNSYSNSHAVKNRVLGKRIDYVMYRAGPKTVVNFNGYYLPLPSRVPNKSYSYSDHEAILVEFIITKDSKAVKLHPDNAAKQMVLEESVSICEEALKSISSTAFWYLFGVGLLIVLFILSLLIPAIINLRFLDNNPIIFAILRVIFVILILFCFLMATLWSKIERHGVLSGKLAMEVSLRNIKEDEKNL